jgi:hypothetical protein
VIGAEDEGHRIEQIDGGLGGGGAGFTLHCRLRISVARQRRNGADWRRKTIVRKGPGG